MCVNEREREKQCVLHNVHFNVSETIIIGPNLFVACVTSEKERKKTSTMQRKISTASIAARLLLYPPKISHSLKFYFLHTYFLIEESLSVACFFLRLGSFFPTFEGVYSLYLQVCVSVNEFITLRMNEVHLFETSEGSYPTRRC